MSAEAVIFRYNSLGFSFMMYADRLDIHDASPQSTFRKQGGRGTIHYSTIRDVRLDQRTHALRIVTADTQHNFVLGNQAHQAYYLLTAALARYADRQRALPKPRRVSRLALGLVAAVVLLLATFGIVAGSSALLNQKTAPTLAAATVAPFTNDTDTDIPDTPALLATSGYAAAAVPPVTVTTCADKLCVHYIDVGQGDSILVQAPDGTTALIDGGNPGSGTLAYLQKLGVSRIDVMLLSHPHRDHVGGLTAIINTLQVGRVITTGALANTTTFRQFLNAIERRKVPLSAVARGDNIPFGTLSFSVIHALSSDKNMNDTSMVLRLQDNGVSFLFTGDAEKNAENAMLRDMPDQLRATFLKVGHHGSNTSSSAAFLAAVQPKVAIYSAGRNNPYGHPHKLVIGRLRKVGAQIYGTNVHGSVVVVTDGADYTIVTQTQAAPLDLSN